MRRRPLLIAAAALVFLLVSFELARYLSAPGAEREEIAALLAEQARGDGGALEARLTDGCTPRPCAELTARLRRPGDPKVLSITSRTAYTLSSSEGRTRVAWATIEPESAAVVQCVTVRKRWSWTAGARVTLRALSAPIASDGGC